MFVRVVLSIALLLSAVAVTSAATVEVGPLTVEGNGATAKVAQFNAHTLLQENLDAIANALGEGENIDNVIINSTDWDGFTYTITYSVVIYIPDP